MPSPQSGIRTKKKLLETAQDFLGRGDLEVNVETIAKEAGVSVGSLYTYFSDKNDLFTQAAEDALLEVVPELDVIVSKFDDPTLGFLCSVVFHCHRSEFDLQTARIILNSGPLGFAKYDEHRTGPIRAIENSMERGLNTCTDAEAFFSAVAGAFQEVLAQYFLGKASPHLAERVMQGFALQIGYSAEQFEEVIIQSQRFIAERIRTGVPLTSISVPTL
jgi:AcrR family transcriptional regulator